MTGTGAKGGSASFDRPHQGRVALITGGSRGIGQSVAVELARRGAHVVIGARTDQSETAQLVADAGGEALALTLDIGDPASVEEARTRVEAGFGQVDILVNNAATFESVTWDVGIRRDRQPRLDRLPRKQDGNHRADASLIGDARR
jgi:NAD(P)-dependent dehydrogenase (short-subunit alcohol dehydrogenase family)